jgi:glycine cleavage system aminomethyltransferase T
MLNAAGCVEADVTVNKLADDSFVVVATDTAHRHVQTLLRRGIEDNVGAQAEKSGAEKSGAEKSGAEKSGAEKSGAEKSGARAHAFVTDITGSLAQINIQGPNARRLMQACTDADMSDAAFPFRASREIAIGYALGTVGQTSRQ